MTSCAKEDNSKKVENFLKQIYIPEENEVYKQEGQALGEGVDENVNSEDELEKYLQEKFTPLMTEEGYNSIRGTNPLIWLGFAKNQDNIDIHMSNLQVNKIEPEKASPDFEYYEFKFDLEFSRDNSNLDTQEIRGQIRLTKDGLVDNFREETHFQIPQ
ncbi:MAG: hypothetical protein Q4E02_04520 [Lagierella massiliensis]|nr:hypothetical protein [Lagierella massiliensis]